MSGGPSGCSMDRTGAAVEVGQRGEEPSRYPYLSHRTVADLDAGHTSSARPEPASSTSLAAGQQMKRLANSHGVIGHPPPCGKPLFRCEVGFDSGLSMPVVTISGGGLCFTLDRIWLSGLQAVVTMAQHDLDVRAAQVSAPSPLPYDFEPGFI